MNPKHMKFFLFLLALSMIPIAWTAISVSLTNADYRTALRECESVQKSSAVPVVCDYFLLRITDRQKLLPEEKKLLNAEPEKSFEHEIIPIFIAFLGIGLIPFGWVFFLTRLRELSRAIRGID